MGCAVKPRFILLAIWIEFCVVAAIVWALHGVHDVDDTSPAISRGKWIDVNINFQAVYSEQGLGVPDVINVGQKPGDGTGDTLLVALDKVNHNLERIESKNASQPKPTTAYDDHDPCVQANAALTMEVIRNPSSEAARDYHRKYDACVNAVRDHLSALHDAMQAVVDETEGR